MSSPSQSQSTLQSPVVLKPLLESPFKRAGQLRMVDDKIEKRCLQRGGVGVEESIVAVDRDIVRRLDEGQLVSGEDAVRLGEVLLDGLSPGVELVRVDVDKLARVRPHIPEV